MSGPRHPNAPDGAEVIPLFGEGDSRPARDGRTLPHDETAERAIVGLVLSVGKAALVLAAPDVGAQDFYHPTLAAIYQAALDLDEKGDAIDTVTVPAQMREADTFSKLRAHGGELFFSELQAAEGTSTVEAIPFYARRVRALAANRRAMEAAQEIAAKGYGPDGQGAEYAAKVAEVIEAATAEAATTTAVHVKEGLAEVAKQLEKRYERKQAITGVPSGFPRLDEITAGWQPETLDIIAATVKMGKTSLALACCLNAGIEHKIPSLIFSMEMSRGALVERLVASESRVDSTRIRSGMLEQRDWVNVTKAYSRIASAPIHIDHTPTLTVSDIRVRARRWRAQQKEDLVLIVVDYLQLVAGRKQSGRGQQNREREVAEISRGLKALAGELKCPVLALAQLNRELEKRQDKRPQLSDIRESGAIAADADVVTFVYRDEVYNKDTPDKNVAEIIVAAQRNGPTGTARLAFLSQYTRFESLAAGRDDDDYRPPDRGWQDGRDDD